MKRVIARVQVFLLIGAAINVAVAWGCLAAARTGKHRSAEAVPGDRRWTLDAPEGFEHRSAELVVSNGRFGVRRATYFVMVSHQPPPPGNTDLTGDATYPVLVTDCGWPMESLWYRSIRPNPNAAPPTGMVASIRNGVGLTPDTPAVREYPMVLAVVPLPLGFVADTLLYGSAVGLVAWAPGAMRRGRRRRRGLCERCAYPVGTSPVCTECGGSVTLRAGAGA